jgi:hypothetical protein
MLESLVYGFLIGIPIWFIVLSTKKESEEEKIKAEKYQTYLLTILLINSILIILSLIFKKIYEDLLVYYFYTRSTLVIDLVCIINIIVKIINKIKNKILLSKNFYLYILNLIGNFVRHIVYLNKVTEIYFKNTQLIYDDGISFRISFFTIIFVDIILLMAIFIKEKFINKQSQ